jgi:tyrosine-protein phosphatase SIW14
MLRYLKPLFVFLIAFVMVGGPLLYYSHQHRTFRNFHVVRDGVLYRSGQLTVEGLKRKVYELGIKTVVSLRDSYQPGGTPPDLEEESFCRVRQLNHYRIPPRAWWASDGTVPADKGIALFRKIMSDPANYPVLVHCMAGIHRTGAYCAVYRMEHESWSNARALQEMKDLGYDTLDDDWDILTYLEQYQPRSRASESAEAEAEQP